MTDLVHPSLNKRLVRISIQSWGKTAKNLMLIWTKGK